MNESISRIEVISFLKSKKNYLKEQFGVLNIGIFGSYAKGSECVSSDIDFLVEFDKVSFDNLAGLYIYLEKNLGKKVDIIIKSTYLRKKFLDLVEKEVVYA